MSNFDKLSKDVITYLALNYELGDIASFCRVSRRFNELICLNNNFWISKLKKDYGLTIDDLPTGFSRQKIRDYYQNITENVKNFHPDRLLFEAVGDNRLDLVKIALDRRADINYGSPIPLVRALNNDHDKIIDYLLQRDIINSRFIAIQVIKAFLNKIDRTGKLKDVKRLYNKILPATYEFFTRDKIFWRRAHDKLTEFHNNPKIDVEDLYNRHIEKLKELAGL